MGAARVIRLEVCTRARKEERGWDIHTVDLRAWHWRRAPEENEKAFRSMMTRGMAEKIWRLAMYRAQHFDIA